MSKDAANSTTCHLVLRGTQVTKAKGLEKEESLWRGPPRSEVVIP